MTISLVRSLLVSGGLLAAAMPAFADDYSNAHLLSDANTVAANTSENLVLIDVRSAEAFAQGHIPGAMHLEPDVVADPAAPVGGTLRPIAEIVDMLTDLGVSADAQVVLYDDKGGFHAARMFWLLEYLGHRQVSLLDGGIHAWQHAGHALSTEPSTAPEKADFSPALTARRHATADWILERETDENTIVIDVRPASLFNDGHIPWATNIPWKGNLNADKTMKSADELQAHFAGHGIASGSNIVVHCQNGLASAHSYFALRLIGYAKVRTYHRSWAEWGSAGDLPVHVPTDS